MYVGIAGFTLAVEAGDLQGLTIAPAAAYRSFLVPDAASPDVRLIVRAGVLDARLPPQLVFDSGGSWRLYRDGDEVVVLFATPALGPVPYKIARFDSRFARGTITLHRPYFQESCPVDPLQYPLDELLVNALLGRGLGVELHACGVAIDDDGYLFVGQSGAGKSTMARLCSTEAAATILSDDRIVVRTDGGAPWMFGTPWHGDEPLASPARARLREVFLLRQDPGDALLDVPRGEAVARLLAASFPAFHDRSALSASLDALEAIVGQVPVRELRFTATPQTLTLIRRKPEQTPF